MFIAHLPGGYLLTRYLQRKLNIHRLLWIGLGASVLPDIDLFYFYLIDHQQTLHHHYWTHLPIFWAAAWIALTLIFTALRRRELLQVSTLFFANISPSRQQRKLIFKPRTLPIPHYHNHFLFIIL